MLFNAEVPVFWRNVMLLSPGTRWGGSMFLKTLVSIYQTAQDQTPKITIIFVFTGMRTLSVTLKVFACIFACVNYRI